MPQYPGAYEDAPRDDSVERGHMAGPSGDTRSADDVEGPMARHGARRAPLQGSPAQMAALQARGRLSASELEAQDVETETASVISDVEEQSQNVEDGLLTMPMEVARDSVGRWAKTLRSLGDARLETVVRSLGDLSVALDGDEQGKLQGPRIGEVLGRLGLDVRGVARERGGALGMALERLGDCLVGAGMALRRDYQ